MRSWVGVLLACAACCGSRAGETVEGETAAGVQRALVRRAPGARAVELWALGTRRSHHVTVWSADEAAARLVAGPYLADPFGVPRPPEVDVHSIRVVEWSGLGGGLEVREIRCARRATMEVTLDGVPLGSLEDGAVVQTWEPELGGVFVTRFEVPLEGLDLREGGAAVLEWRFRDVGEEEVRTGSLRVERNGRR